MIAIYFAGCALVASAVLCFAVKFPRTAAVIGVLFILWAGIGLEGR